MLQITSITAPAVYDDDGNQVGGIAPRTRCKRAPLNPETDLYDPALAMLVMLVVDSDGTSGEWDGAGLGRQPAWWVEARRVIRGTINRMMDIRTRKAMEAMQRRAQQQPAGRRR